MKYFVVEHDNEIILTSTPIETDKILSEHESLSAALLFLAYHMSKKEAALA